ncbi:band 3 anion exchange protein-like, partial [Clarias magur]
VYVELSELMKNESEQSSLQETGRWQSRDPEVGRRESSHISYLTFKSLIQLRQMMDAGVVMLDIEGSSLPSIMEKTVNEMIERKEIRPDDREGVFKALTQNCSQSVETQALTLSLDIQNFSGAESRDAAESVEASMVFV